MIDLSRALRHLGWADDRFFAGLAELPPAALQSRVAAGEWTVGQLAMHIVGGAEWYRHCLTGAPWTDLRIPQDSDGVRALRSHLMTLDAALLLEAAGPDERVEFEDEDGPRSALRSTILTQACLHAAEHRAQIACALQVSGFSAPVLDDLDLWAFEDVERESAPGA